MKKSFSSRKRQYVGKLFTRSRNPRWDISCYKYLMVFNEVYHNFIASTFAVHFLQKIFMKAVNVPFGICQIKISNNPNHSLSMYDMEKIRSSVPWQYLCFFSLLSLVNKVIFVWVYELENNWNILLSALSIFLSAFTSDLRGARNIFPFAYV